MRNCLLIKEEAPLPTEAEVGGSTKTDIIVEKVLRLLTGGKDHLALAVRHGGEGEEEEGAEAGGQAGTEETGDIMVRL